MKADFGARAFTLAALLWLPCAANAQSIGVSVNGDPVQFYGTQPQQVQGRVMVPLRGVLERMGAVVEWDTATRTAIATRGDTTIRLPIGSYQADVNGRSVPLDVPAMVIGGSTMVPLRFVSEALGAKVAWSDQSRSVMIDTGDAIASNPGEPIGGRRYDSRDTINPPYGDQRDYQDHGKAPVGGEPYDNPNGVNRPGTRPGYPDNYGQTPDRFGQGTPPNRGDQYYNPDRNGQYTPPAGRRQTYAHRGTATFSLPQGVVIPVRLETPLSSDSSRPGDRFTATVRAGADDAGLPEGTRVEGVVREAVPARNGQPGTLDLDFQRLVLPNGDIRHLDGSLISMDSQSVQRDSEGRMVARNNKKNDQLKFIGIGAAGGLLIGSLTKNNALLGALLGAGAGYLYGQSQTSRPRDVRLGAGTEFGIRLNRSLNYAYNQ